MCIVIDTNALGCVFDDTNKCHKDFVHVSNWIWDGKGKVVYGGTTYDRELEKANKFLKVFIRLDKKNKLIHIDNEKVDNKEKEYKQFENNNFDDPHLVAIIAVSGVKLVCTEEKRAIPFLKNKDFYARGKAPKIYASARNKRLLCDSNIAECCKAI